MKRIRFVVFCIIFISAGASFSFAKNTSQKEKKSVWEDKRRVEDFKVYMLLIKSKSTGNFLPEYMQWEDKKPLKDPVRETNLKKLLRKYPNSQFADDAALLLARAKLFYHNDPEGAIKGLYKVIKDYPKGDWIAEDRVWLDSIPMFARGHRDGTRSPREPRAYQPYKRFVYFRYLEANPHKTVDEARYWIAKVILSTDLKKTRFDEAVSNLKLVVDKYNTPEKKRTVKDMNALSKLPEETIKLNWIDRAEIRCHERLILAYMEAKDYVNAAKEADIFLERYHGHPRTKGMYYYAGQSNEALEQWSKAIEYYRVYLKNKIGQKLREDLRYFWKICS